MACSAYTTGEYLSNLSSTTQIENFYLTRNISSTHSPTNQLILNLVTIFSRAVL